MEEGFKKAESSQAHSELVSEPGLPRIQLELNAEPIPRSAQKLGTLEPHPWTRYGARYIDTFVYSLVFGMLLGAVSKVSGLNLEIGTALLTILGVVAGTLLFEPFLLSDWGTTPGKLLFGVRIRNVDGSKLSFEQAAKRSLSVVIKGLGLAIPLFGIPLMIRQYLILKKKGRTSWDENLNVISSHQQVGEFRAFLGLTLIGLALALNYF